MLVQLLSDSLFSVTCVSPRFSSMCSEVTVTGSDYGNCLGIYILSNGDIHDHRPVYVNATKGRIMNYFTANWVSDLQTIVVLYNITILHIKFVKGVL